MRMVYDLLSMGKKIRAMRRPQSDMELFHKVMAFYGDSDTLEKVNEIEWVEGDVMNPLLLEEALQGCSHCIHAAAIVSFHSKDEDEMRQINVEGTANMVNACLSIPNIRLLHVSSVAALGRTGEEGLINEDQVWKDSPYNTAYAVSKYQSEMEVWRGVEEGLEAVIISPSIILGAGSLKKSSGTIFGAVKSGLKFYTDGTASVVDARDVSRMGLDILFSPRSSERYITSAGELPYRELFGRIAKKLNMNPPSIHAKHWMLQIAWRLAWVKDFLIGSRSPITRETARSSTSSYAYDSSRVKENLSTSFFNIEESLEALAPFYLD